MALPFSFGSATSAGANFFAQLQADLEALDTASGGGGGAFSVNRNGVNQTALTGGAENKITFTTEALDVDNYFDTGTSRYTPLVAGWYHIVVRILAAGAVGDMPQAIIRKNGGNVNYGTYVDATSTVGHSIASGIVQVNGSTDFIEGYVYLPAGVTVLDGTAVSTEMFGWRVVAT